MLAEKYRIERLLGSGGMASVWLARNTLLDFPVAVKITHPELHNAEGAALLLAEARMGAHLDHPGAVRTLDYGQTPLGHAYLVMEHLRGRSLAEIMLERGPFSAPLAVQVILPVVDAMRTVHASGIVHRDLKPENVFLAVNAGAIQPKVLDFGIATWRDAEHSTREPAGVLLGSPAYMAPEQAMGLANIDARADVWALCVVIYEMISGKPLFNATDGASLLNAVLHAPIPPLTDTARGEQALWWILRRGLHKDRARRLPSMEELGDALASWLAHRGIKHDVSGVTLKPRFRIRPLASRGVQATREGARCPRAVDNGHTRRIQAERGPRANATFCR